ncbi:MAG: anaerobic glycerol-3-phosphate dehydrogenase subunit C [Planctomycetota bacterium]|nr:anaerobic glycerol-3-phosphate dehydrogenase subunit C [Planctomycetota bacterium]
MPEIETALRERIKGDVRFDTYTRSLYSTDASIYDITPIGVVMPRSVDDVIAVHRYAFENKVAILPRGGGSSLSGQAIGEAIVMDFTRHMNQVLEINAAEKWVRVQPGMVLDDLNKVLRPHGLQFGPDPASSSRAAVGGLIGNNSTGAHSIIHGMTADHVESLDVILPNGDRDTVRAIERDSEEFAQLSHGESSLGKILKGLADLGDEYAFECETRFPKTRRNVAGYNLREAVTSERVDVPRLICGSEGTLVTIVEAKLKLVELPSASGLVLLCFEDLIEALRTVSPILKHKPTAVEVVDEMLIEMAKTNQEHGDTARALPEGTKAALLVEFYGETLDDIRPRLDEIRKLAMEEMGLAFHALEAVDAHSQTAFWNLRKAGLPILLSNPKDAKPTAFVEDTAVPTDVLPEYIEEFLRIIHSHGTTSAVYAHAGGGCLHLRPVINLKDLDEIEKLHEISSEVTDLVIRYGGTTASEHGDGMVRTQWLERLYGGRLVGAFKEIKKLFDPRGIMNPGKIVSTGTDLRANIRHRPGQEIPQLPSALRFDSQIDLLHSVEMCNGCGGCRKSSGGAMCPSFRGAQEEIAATRGRANLMRQAITGKLPRNELTSQQFKEEVLDLCLGCKACKRECPSGVDLAKLKTEIKYQYLQEHGASLGDRFFGHIDTLSSYGSATAPITNWINQSELGRAFLQRFVGIDRRRPLPAFHLETFVKWFESQARHKQERPRGKVAFFYDCYLNHNAPELGKSAVRVLDALGYEVILADRKCCGRAMLSNGFIDDARERAQFNVRRLSDQIRDGFKVVGCEPSCIVTIQDEYDDLLEPSDELDLVKQNTFEFSEFLDGDLEESPAPSLFNIPDQPFIYHGHCHQKATGKAGHVPSLMKKVLGAKVEVLDSGCCGMAGGFGYEKEHYDLSMRIGEILFNQIRQLDGEVIAPGVSCRSQIGHGMDLVARHPAEVLAGQLVQVDE